MSARNDFVALPRVQTRMSDATNPSSTADADLIRAARNGDRPAFGELYKRYAPMVHGLILARVSPNQTEDLVQDVFLRAMTRLHSLREDHHFGGWISKIARNYIIDEYRRRSLPTDSEAEVDIAVEETTTSANEARAILGAIKSLPEAYREVLLLRLVEGMDGPEIAKRTGLTSGSVRVNLHRGMKLLRAHLSGRQSADIGEQQK
jgi:RNA polymerase sigma-70 factor, ECF subfamily